MKITDTDGNEHPDDSHYEFPTEAEYVRVSRQGEGRDGLLVQLGDDRQVTARDVLVEQVHVSPQFGDSVSLSPPSLSTFTVSHDTSDESNHGRIEVTLKDS